MSDDLEVVQVVRLSVGEDEYQGEVTDPKVIDQIRKEYKAFKAAHEKLLATLEEHEIEIAYEESEPQPAPRATARAVKRSSSGPDSADVRVWAAKLTKPKLPLSTAGRIPGWVEEAFEKNVRGDALDKLVRERATPAFLEKYEEANSK
ncbi:hypothetical protein [Streptomyces noursei]|uniref:hypothetical protein n=1 Tax=Streptomyces noursei TaxID=1971 RepID=UPI00167786DA|nr:hypothetical protein [Streptomyces noursei]MCZ1019439.1 hypothetical protein [Streptomyces noursei]GGX08414.1 hypothetical protein GCM10010341_32660 [Streptomyces noursei]